jgi:hypothetical protein
LWIRGRPKSTLWTPPAKTALRPHGGKGLTTEVQDRYSTKKIPVQAFNTQGGARMGDFNHYVDLFKTYGIEYIIIIVFLIAIIFFWRYLSKRPRKKGKKR